MKITVSQLKQLIREQLEEERPALQSQWSTADWASWEAEQKANRAETKYQDDLYAANEKNKAEAAKQKQAEQDEEAYQQRIANQKAEAKAKAEAEAKAKAAAQAKAEAADKNIGNFDGVRTAANIIQTAKRLKTQNLSNQDIKNEIEKQIFSKLNSDKERFIAYTQLPEEITAFVPSKFINSAAFREYEEVISPAGNRTYAPSSGKQGKYYIEGIDPAPSRLGAAAAGLKGFFGMKEVRQLVREEVARQLRNKR